MLTINFIFCLNDFLRLRACRSPCPMFLSFLLTPSVYNDNFLKEVRVHISIKQSILLSKFAKLIASHNERKVLEKESDIAFNKVWTKYKLYLQLLTWTQSEINPYKKWYTLPSGKVSISKIPIFMKNIFSKFRIVGKCKKGD